MNLTLRSKIILSLLIGVILFLVIFAIVRLTSFVKKAGQGTNGAIGVEVPVPSPTPSPEPSPTPNPSPAPAPQPIPPPQRSAGEADLASIALPFAERFGSYSNQSSYENLSDLLPFMTEDFKKWAQGKINEQLAKPYQPIYQGVTTKALSYSMKMFDEQTGIAEMAVSTQRREMIGSPANTKIYNQDVTLKFVKSDDIWLVDRAEWK
ncbi:MAG: hypothetical protein AAB400_02645 [Patescibacteria group bacterium]